LGANDDQTFAELRPALINKSVGILRRLIQRPDLLPEFGTEQHKWILEDMVNIACECCAILQGTLVDAETSELYDQLEARHQESERACADACLRVNRTSLHKGLSSATEFPPNILSGTKSAFALVGKSSITPAISLRQTTAIEAFIAAAQLTEPVDFDLNRRLHISGLLKTLADTLAHYDQWHNLSIIPHADAHGLNDGLIIRAKQTETVVLEVTSAQNSMGIVLNLIGGKTQHQVLLASDRTSFDDGQLNEIYTIVGNMTGPYLRNEKPTQALTAAPR
jgi:hypothetical protein